MGHHNHRRARGGPGRRRRRTICGIRSHQVHPLEFGSQDWVCERIRVSGVLRTRGSSGCDQCLAREVCTREENRGPLGFLQEHNVYRRRTRIKKEGRTWIFIDHNSEFGYMNYTVREQLHGCCFFAIKSYFVQSMAISVSMSLLLRDCKVYSRVWLFSFSFRRQ